MLDPARRVGADQCAVCRECEAETLFPGVACDLVEMRMNERFAARKQQRGHAIVGEVVNHILALIEREFSGILAGVAVGVAVDAFQIAPPRDVPDNDRFSLGCGLRGTVSHSVAQVVGVLRNATVESRKIDHGFAR